MALLHRVLSDGGRHELVATDLTPLAECCGRLPLALRLAASYLTTYRDWSLPDYLSALDRAPLAYLAVPGEKSVQAVLGLSIGTLRERDAVLAGRWEQLAVFPAAFDRAAAAAVWGALRDAPLEDMDTWPEPAPLDEEEVRQGLSTLVQQSLLDYDAASATYTMHDLLRECALAAPSIDMDGARLRHAWHYLREGSVANDAYVQGGAGVMAGLLQFERARPHLAVAWGWLQGRTDGAARRWVNVYPDAIVAVLNLGVAPQELIAVLKAAVEAARVLGDRAREAVHLGNVGLAYADQGAARRGNQVLRGGPSDQPGNW